MTLKRKISVLKIFSSFNLYGGTPTKILEIGKWSKNEIIFYLYERFNIENDYIKFKEIFIKVNRKIHEAYYNKNYYKHYKGIARIDSTSNLDIIHTYFSFGQMIGFFFKFLNPRKKWVISFVTPEKPSRFKNIILNLIFRKVDGVIYISEYVKKEKIAQFEILKYKKNAIIYNGAVKKNIETKIERKADTEMLFIGGLVDWKNAILLLKIAEILKDENFDFFLTIIGDGKERKNLEEYIHLHKLESFVDIIGYSSNVGGYIETCDIYLHPSLTEGFGIAVIEAMMFAKPVLVANSGALPELLTDSINGFILDPFNPHVWSKKIIHLSENKEILKKLGINASKHANSNFSIEKFVENHDIFYGEVVAL